ncbi:MAG TPA: hypothetical protein VHG91_17810 [Longimicrobium sp.]|nr:hypothetical protein [Longimicrobium sp.]
MRLTARTFYGAAVAAALGFGATQAAAAPAAEAAPAQSCATLCNRLCQAIGTIGGTCTPDGSCFCYLRR